MLPLLLRLVFTYFSSGTFIHLTRAFISNPGYLPAWLKTPLNSRREAPLALVRVYNMRFWMANGIYNFEEFIAPDDSEAKVEKEDDNIEISIAGSESFEGANQRASDSRLLSSGDLSASTRDDEDIEL